MDKYKLTINEEEEKKYGKKTGISKVSYTKNPAIITKGMAFTSEEKELKFTTDEVKMRIVAPAMSIGDIYRYDKGSDYEYEVVFEDKDIDILHQDFMKNLVNKDIFNVEHKDIITPSYLLECWRVETDPKLDKAWTKYGLDVKKGDLMVITQFTDKEYYDKIVSEGMTGLSIEGLFSMVPIEMMLNKKEEEKMELKLEDGEYIKDNFKFTIENGIVVSTVEIEKEVEQVNETEVEPVIEIEMSDKPLENGATASQPLPEQMVDAPTAPQINEEEILRIIQPKIDEILSMIADINVKLEKDNVEEETDVQMSENEIIKSSFSEISRSISELTKIKNG